MPSASHLGEQQGRGHARGLESARCLMALDFNSLHQEHSNLIWFPWAHYLLNSVHSRQSTVRRSQLKMLSSSGKQTQASPTPLKSLSHLQGPLLENEKVSLDLLPLQSTRQCWASGCRTTQTLISRFNLVGKKTVSNGT